MHKNRTNYDLETYQKKIRSGACRLGVVLEKDSDGSFYIFHPKPTCPWLPETRKKYFKKIRQRAKNIPKNKHYTFCTLTYSTKLYTDIQVAKRVKRDIDLFFKRLNYRKKKPEYFYVIELTKNNYVHIHLIFDRFVFWLNIKKSWWSVTGSNVIKIKDLKNYNVFAYITKYTTDAQKQKESQWAFMFKNVDRLYSFSRNFCLKSDSTNKKNTFWFAFFSNQENLFTQDSQNVILDYSETEIYMLWEACVKRKENFLLHFNPEVAGYMADVEDLKAEFIADTSRDSEFPF